MAALSTTDRRRVAAGLMRYWSAHGEAIPGVVKADILNAVNATDSWIDNHAGNTGNTTGYNGALSGTFKTAATAAQKSLLFCAVATMRTDPELVKRLIGRVD